MTVESLDSDNKTPTKLAEHLRGFAKRSHSREAELTMFAAANELESLTAERDVLKARVAELEKECQRLREYLPCHDGDEL